MVGLDQVVFVRLVHEPYHCIVDEQLLGLFLGGDKESFNVLVGRWEGPLYHFAYRFLGQHEEARDVCQETFLRVYRRADRFRDGAKFSTWLYQIALNLCRDVARKRKRWDRIHSARIVLDSAASPCSRRRS